MYYRLFQGIVPGVLLLASLVVQLCGATQPEAVDGPSYSLSEGWQLSSLTGADPDKPTYYTTTIGATASWRPGFAGPVRARVWFHKIVHTAGNDPKVKIEIVHAAKTEQRFVDCSSGATGWMDLGEFTFAGRGDEAVRLVKIGKGTTRTSAVRFDVLGDDGKTAVQSYTMDELTAGPMAAARVAPAQFDDLAGDPNRAAIESLATRGVAEPARPGTFAPAEPITAEDWSVWLLRAMGRMQTNPGAPSRKPIDPASARATLTLAKELKLVSGGGGPMSAEQWMASLASAVKASGRNMEWAGAALAGESPADMLSRLAITRDLSISVTPTRGQAAVALRRFMQTVVEAGPPGGATWKLTFQDEFKGEALDRAVWDVESGSPGHIQSSRWPENVKVSEGQLHLLTKKEPRGGKDWTSGNVWTKAFKQQYGYFECRMRVGTASGLNNAFWLMTTNKPTDPVHFEIDITEAHYPDRHTFHVHQWSGKHFAKGNMWRAPERLSDDFHVYAVEWTPQNIIFYFDGREVYRLANEFCHDKSPIRLSSAVAPFAGRITDALDGTEMTVDWVRVYQRGQ